MAEGDIYIKRNNEILGPYTWDQMQLLASAGELNWNEFIADSPDGPFIDRHMKTDLYLDQFETPDVSDIRARRIIRYGGLILILSNIALIGWAIIIYVQMKAGIEANPGMSADNRFVYAIDEMIALVLITTSLITFPGHLVLYWVRGFRVVWPQLFLSLIMSCIFTFSL